MMMHTLKQGVKRILVPLKHGINRYPALKRPIMAVLHRFPDLEYRLKRLGRPPAEQPSRYIPAFTPNAARVFACLAGHQKESEP